MVIDRGAFLAGRYLQGVRRDQRREARPAATSARLKVIFETGELSTYDNIRRASLARHAGRADFIKTSTGKVAVNATPPTPCSCWRRCATSAPQTGVQIGVKPAGGIRTTKDAIKYLVMVNETAGEDWLDPRLVPLRRLQPAQRPADAAAEAAAPAATPAPTT